MHAGAIGAAMVTIARQFWTELLVAIEACDARSVVDRENAIIRRIIENGGSSAFSEQGSE
jgi:hypothetical protein